MKNTYLSKYVINASIMLAISPLFYHAQSWSFTAVDARKAAQPVVIQPAPVQPVVVQPVPIQPVVVHPAPVQPAPVIITQPDLETKKKLDYVVQVLNNFEKKMARNDGPQIGAVNADGANIDAFIQQIEARMNHWENLAAHPTPQPTPFPPLNTIIAALNEIQVASIPLAGPPVQAVNHDGMNIENFKQDMIAKLGNLNQHHAQSQADLQTRFDQMLQTTVTALNEIQAASIPLAGPAVQAVNHDGNNIENFKQDMIAKLGNLNQHHAQSQADLQTRFDQIVIKLNSAKTQTQAMAGPAIVELLADGSNINAFTETLVKKLQFLVGLQTVSDSQKITLSLVAFDYNQYITNQAEKFVVPNPFDLDPYINLSLQMAKSVSQIRKYLTNDVIDKFAKAIGDPNETYNVNAPFNAKEFAKLVTKATLVSGVYKEHMTNAETRHFLHDIGVKLNINNLRNLALSDEPLSNVELNIMLKDILDK